MSDEAAPAEDQINALELIHDYLIDQRILNIVIDKREPVPITKGLISAGPSILSGSFEDDDESRLLLVAPLDDVPSITLAQVWTRKSMSDENGKVRICIFSHLLKLFDTTKYKKQGTVTEVALNLEDPTSLDRMIELLGQIVDRYNEFGTIMNKVGVGLLSDYLMWSDMEFRPAKLKR